MEPILNSDLLNDSILDYWNPDHNPLLSPPMISTTDSETINGLYLGGESHSDIEDRNKIVHCHMTDNPKKEGHGEMEFTDHNNSPWLHSGEGKDQGINPTVVENEGFLQERHFLSPSCANGTDFLDGLDKDSETFLDNDILTTSDLYSPLKENSGFDPSEATALPLADDFTEGNQTTTHLLSLEEEGQDDMWQAVGVIETRAKEKPLALHNLNHPQSNKSMQDKYMNCPPKKLHHPVTNKIHPQCLSRSKNHHFGSPAPLGRVHQSVEYSLKNHFRFKKSRCRKPLVRNFQANFFRLPIQSRSKSPQLQMVKLIRSSTNACNERDPSFQDDLHTNEDCVMKSVEDHPLEDNPKLALMKTVDMPSGKRVEDIYVVPSVWITNTDSPDIRKGKSLPEQRPNVSLSPNVSLGCMPGSNPLCLGVSYSSNNSDPCQNSNSPSFPTSLVISPTCQPSTNVAKISSPSQEVNWSADRGNGVMKNFIITTLNAPKIDMIPCLKDLCKAVLHNQLPSLWDEAKANSTQGTPIHSENLKGVSPPQFSVLVKDKTDQPINRLSDAEAQDFGNENHLHSSPDQPSHLLGIHNFTGENSLLKSPSSDFTDSFSVQDLPQLNAMNSPRSGIDMKQTSFTQERHGPDNPYRSQHFQESSVEISNTDTSLRDDAMPSLCAINNESSSSSHAQAFNTNSQQMIISNSCESVNSSCDNTNEGSTENAHTVSSLPEASSSSSFIDSPFAGEINEEDSYNPPELVALMRQINTLHLNDPINKPLANLSTTLHLLHDAEKTLCNANFGIYQQLKMGQHSRFGQLIRCILSLTSSVVMMGKSLCEWTRSSADHHSLKTVEVLSNLYHTNIISLIELITPYFHYLCGLIASCHSDILGLNRAKTSIETGGTDDIEHSYGLAYQQHGISEVLRNKNSLHYPNCHPVGMLSNDPQGYSNHNGNALIHLCQNSANRRLQSERELSMVHSDTAPTSHKQGRGSPIVRKRKKQKAKLLKQWLPNASKSSPCTRQVDLTSKTSVTDVKYFPMKANANVMVKKVFDYVNPNKISNTTSPSLFSHILNTQVPSTSQTKMPYQAKSSADPAGVNGPPLVMSFRPPLPDSSKSQPTYNVGPKPFTLRDHDSNLSLSGVFGKES